MTTQHGALNSFSKPREYSKEVAGEAGKGRETGKS